MNITTSDYWKLFPIMAVRDGIIVSKRGDLTVGWEMTLPPLCSADREGMETSNAKFAEAMRLLPPWMLVHRQDLYLRRTYKPEESRSFLGRCYESHFAGREYLEHRQHIFLTLTGRSSALKPTPSSGLFGNPGSGAVPKRQDARKLETAAAAFMSKLTESRRISARRLPDRDLIGLIDSYRRLGDPDRMLTDLEYRPDRVRMGDTTLRAYVLSESKDLPVIMQSSMADEVHSGRGAGIYLQTAALAGPLLDCEHMVNTYFLTSEKDRDMAEIEARRRRMTSMSKNSMENRSNASEIGEFQKEIYRRDSSMVRAHMNVMVWGRDSEMDGIHAKVSSALSSMGAVPVLDTLDAPVIFYAGMPGAGCELGSDNFMKMDMEGAMCLNMSETYDSGIPGGILKLCDRTRHIPVTADFQEAAAAAGLVGNCNAFILGESGAGKSFFTNHLARCCYDAGESVFLIDMGDSYEGLCSVIREESGGRDGHYHTWDRNDPISFDAFRDMERWTDRSGNLNAESDGLNFILSFMQTLWTPAEGWTQDMANILKSMVRDFALSWTADRGRPILEDLLQYLRTAVLPRLSGEGGPYLCGGLPISSSRFDLKGFLLAMEDYSAAGPFGFLLNDRHPKDFLASRFTVFEVAKMTDIRDAKFFPLVILCIMNAFNARMKGTPGQKVIIIDEAWKAIANDVMAGYLTGVWKTARKYRTSAVVVTQQISDIMHSTVVKDTIIQNSAVRILLSQPGSGADRDSAAEFMGLDRHERDLAATMNGGNDSRYRYKEVFIKLGTSSSAIYCTEVSPEEAVAYESRKEVKEPWKRLAEREGYIRAISGTAGRTER